MRSILNIRLFSGFLSLAMLVGMTNLTSCIKDYDEPTFENPEPEQPEPEEPGTDEPGTDEPGDVEITDNIKNLTVGETLSTTAVVTAQNSRGLIITDNGGSIYVYNTNLDLASYPVGTIVEAQGKVANFGTGLQLDSSATLTAVGNEEYTYPTPEAYTGAMVDAAAANTEYVLSTYVTVTGKLSISGNYYNFEIEGASTSGSVSYPDDALKAELTEGQTYTFTGYFSGISGSNPKYFNVVVTEFTKVSSDEGGNSGSDDTQNIPAIFSSEPYGYVILPESVPQQYKAYTGFNVSYNKDAHAPNYVAWLLTSTEARSNAVNTSRDYWQDSGITGCAPVSDGWSAQGYDRGHMCPAADQKWSEAAMKDAASMANMCPQLAAYNQGIWANLENKERDWAKSYGEIYIICGPIYDVSDSMLTVGKANTRVADAFFKAFLYFNGENSEAIAYVIPHMSSGLGGYAKYAMSIDELEEETGYDFFSALPDDIEKKVEATYNASKWQ